MLNRFSKARTKRNDEGAEEMKISRAMVYEAGKKTLKLLRATAPLVPVPFVTPVLDTLLALIDLCENLTALRGQVEDLKDRLHKLLGILIESGKGGSLPDETDRAIEGLSTDLESIKAQLQKVNDQKKVFRILLADDNKNTIDECVKLLDASLQRFNLSHAITTKQDLHRIIQSVEDLAKWSQRIEDSLKASMQNQQPHNAPIFTSTGMPAPLTHFRGRPGMIADVGNLLCSGDPTKCHVAILATGGMGKTTVAVQVMKSDIVASKFDGNRFWISCTGATSFSLFLQVLAVSLRIKTDSVDLQADIKSGLTASEAPRLIVLDNFETPWDTSEKSDVERVLCSLASIRHVAIVLTMRSNYPPSKQNINWHVEDLKPLDKGASREIYTDINPSAKDHKALENLLNALGHMPFAVKLIATLGEESDSPPDTLLKIWNERGTRAVGDEIDRSISLSVDSALLRSHPEALSLLVILSMLPAGATRDHIDWWAAKLGSDIPLAISTLSKTALITKLEEPSDSPTYLVYPVVQSYMEHSGLILPKDRVDLQEAAFTFILNHKLFLSDPQFKDNLKALASEDINLQGILAFAAQQRMQKDAQSNEISDKKLLDALIIFSCYQLALKPTLDIATLAVNIAHSLDSKLHLAEGLDCLGSIRYRLSDYDGAIDAYREARALCISLSNPFLSVRIAFMLMTSYHFCNNMSAANALEEELRAYSKALKADDRRQFSALTQCTIAVNLMQKNGYEEALAHLSDALDFFEQTDHSSDRALCLQILCECYGHLGRYRESMEAAQLAAREYEYLGLDGGRNWVRALECNLLLVLKDYDQALHVSETFLQEIRKLGDVLSTARALEFIAQVFEQRGDLAAVRLGYESALEQYKIVGRSAVGQDGMRRCEHNLELLAQAMAGDGDGEGDIISDGRHLMPQLENITLFWHDASSMHSSDTGSGVAEST